MKKTILTAVVASSALMLFAKPANAEVVGQDQTDVGIRFDTDGPVKPGPGPFRDNLALVFTPSEFNFGKQKATGNVATYNNTVAGDQYVVVNDDREGTTTGKEGEEVTTTTAWKTTASLSPLVSKDNTETELPAKLLFNLEEPQAYDIGTDIDDDTNDYNPNPIEGNLSKLPEGNNILTGNSVTLEAGNTTASTILAKTKADTLTGGVATKLTDTKLTVTSGSGASGKSFKGTVTWTLDNTY